ncbi:hypothetical protein M885DRAFT_591336 [Pelagophyceae sp. CCMP2097]|nr:hypothetical protein M885DRAFT_591336 [Pelagophyceae sp. CCMP2097]
MRFAVTALTALRAAPRHGVQCRALGTISGVASSYSAIDLNTPIFADAARRNADPDAVFVVLGASRGIGAEFARQLLDRTAGTVVACCRSPATAALAPHARLQVFQLDVTDASSIAALAARVPRADTLVNCVGVLHADGNMPERKLGDVDPTWLATNFAVNCGAAVHATAALQGALRAGSDRPGAVVAHLSARVGSISDNNLGGWYSYRMSKAALNMFTRTSAIELRRQRTACVSLHPGTTRTGLSEPFQARVSPDKLFEVDYTVSQLLAVIDRLELDRDTGGFFAYDGAAIEY